MWHWLTQTGHLYSALVGALTGLIVTTVFVGVIYGMIIKPMIHKLKGAYHKHEQVQLQIADSLNPTTPGGIAPVLARLAEEENREQESGSGEDQ